MLRSFEDTTSTTARSSLFVFGSHCHLQIMFLDLLHEDMNRISKKPYIEYPVYTSFSPEQSSEMWNFHLQRNQSPIIDWFYGQTVTFVRCTECGEVSPLHRDHH